jgi:hypothetical protein
MSAGNPGGGGDIIRDLASLSERFFGDFTHPVDILLGVEGASVVLIDEAGTTGSRAAQLMGSGSKSEASSSAFFSRWS